MNTDTGGPAGVDSPSLLGPEPDSLRKVETAISLDAEYWGGEAYYIVISAPGLTRYNLTIRADAQDDTYGTNSEAPEEDDLEDAEQSSLTRSQALPQRPATRLRDRFSFVWCEQRSRS